MCMLSLEKHSSVHLYLVQDDLMQPDILEFVFVFTIHHRFLHIYHESEVPIMQQKAFN